jgi:signal transduction histidine kinase
MISALRASAIRTLYLQARNSAVAALVVTIYMTVTAWPFTPARVVLSWLAAQMLVQLARLALIQAFMRTAPADAQLPRWAAIYTGYMAVAGLLWGLAGILFMHPHEPVTLALTLCGLYGITSGSVPGNAYNRSGLDAFVITIFGCVLIHLIASNDIIYSALGIASAFYAGILMLFCRVQERTILESFSIRFQNEELVAELRQRTAEAEQARRTAEAASLAKSQFLAAASHDLRQPLHALGLLAGALAAVKKPHMAVDVVENIQANVGALEGLFNGLLDIARFDANAVGVELVPIASDEIFDRLEHYLRPMADDFGLDLRFRSDGSLLYTDPLLIEQILSNLAANALRNAKRGGVLIAARRRGDRVRLEIWDQGSGIAEADRSRIFDEFVQVGNPERDRRKGMGLGLTIARRAARLLGSDVQFCSVLGRGSVFWLDQPLSDQPAARAGVEDIAVAPSALAPGGTRSVLVLDDDPAVRDACSTLLGSWGIDALCVSSTSEAETALAGRHFSLLLIDYRLSGPINGLDFLKVHHGRHAAAPFAAYLLTGDLSADLIASAGEAGIPLLQKPLSPRRLRSLL